MGKDWFSAKNLEKSRVEHEKADPFSTMSGGGDFSSYAKVNRGAGLLGSDIENHNLVNPAIRVRLYNHILGPSPRSKIADLGCGLGFSSKALADIFSAKVDGYEVSLDAIQFATKKWPSLRFIKRVIEQGVPLDEMYDLIVAQEFYPFTRTADLDVHLGYIEALLKNLNDKGVILIGLSEGTKESILSNISEIQDRIKNNNMKASVMRLPFDRVFQKIQLYSAANFLSWLLSFLTKKPRFCVLLIEKR